MKSEEWIFQTHDRYGEVIERGKHQPLLVVIPSNKKQLGISSDSKFFLVYWQSSDGKVAKRTTYF